MTVTGSVRSVAASHTESGRVSRADTEPEPEGKLAARDKTILACLWCLSLLYGMMTDQLVSKVVDRPCGVREQLNTGLEVASVMAGLVLPFLLGTLQRLAALDCNFEDEGKHVEINCLLQFNLIQF